MELEAISGAMERSVHTVFPACIVFGLSNRHLGKFVTLLMQRYQPEPKIDSQRVQSPSGRFWYFCLHFRIAHAR
jgi:hypothetical protein